ncbi:MAG: hypothetical protein KDJ29_02755 [Hyphomicrobiales bacterium]|nr:hypothetical protein [Hyphomicrobiales bacterium]
MDDDSKEISAVPPSIKGAMRRARIEEAERSDVIAELRGAEITRLEILAERLEPVYAQIPDDVDMFDAGVAPGEHPRLFIDMIGFVDMGDDKRTYRFVQDTRHGRVVIKETDRTETMVGAIADYIGRRLLERERALASDRTVENAARALIAQSQHTGSTATATRETAGAETGANGQAAAQASDASAASEHRANEPTRFFTNNNAPRAGNRSASMRSGESITTHADPVEQNPAAPATAPRRGAFAWLWDTIEFLALFIGFVVMLIGLAGAVYFVWRLGDSSPFWKFFQGGA